MSTAGVLLFAFAYARGEASYLSVTEYSAFIWAALLGWLMFGEPCRGLTLAGAVLIVAGCLIAARKGARRRTRNRGRRLARAEHVDGEGEHADVEEESGEAWSVTTRRDPLAVDRHVATSGRSSRA